MPRIARVVAKDYPHHVTQRGNYKQPVFEEEQDYAQYLQWLKQYSHKNGLDIWAYCLMANHVHFVCVPRSLDALAKTFNMLHMRYAQYFNKKRNQRGHLWQGRFYSCILDERHVYAAVRYIENNPVRAGLVKKAEEYPWTSALNHIQKQGDEILSKTCYLTDEVVDWSRYLTKTENDTVLIATIKKNALTGRPCGDDVFIRRLERKFGCRLKALAHGRPRKEEK